MHYDIMYEYCLTEIYILRNGKNEQAELFLGLDAVLYNYFSAYSESLLMFLNLKAEISSGYLYETLTYLLPEYHSLSSRSQKKKYIYIKYVFSVT